MDDLVSLVDLTANIVSAYVSNNEIHSRDLPDLIRTVYSTLHETRNGAGSAPAEVAAAPAVNPRKSVTPEFLVCLEDGKHFKSLKRHLQAHHGLSPAEYRAKWGLPKDYPMVAPAYTETRSRLALANGLGKKRRVRR